MNNPNLRMPVHSSMPYPPAPHVGNRRTSARARKFVIDNLGCIVLAVLALGVGCCAGMFLIQFMGG